MTRPVLVAVENDPEELRLIERELAVGDVRHGSVKRVAAAVGDDWVGIRLLHEFLAQLEQLQPGQDLREAQWRYGHPW